MVANNMDNHKQQKKGNPDIVAKIPAEWFNFFEKERLKTGFSLSLQVRFAIIEIYSEMEKPLSSKDLNSLKKSIDETKMPRGGRGVARGLKAVRVFLGPSTTELRQIAKDNKFPLSDLLRAFLNLYFKKLNT